MSTQTADNNKRIAKNTVILYARTLFIGANDTIDNYIEIDAPVATE